MHNINPVLCQTQADKIPKIQQDYNVVKQNVSKKSPLLSIFDVIPTFRRIERVPSKIENSDFVPAAGLATLAMINVPEDIRDVKSAYKQIKSKFTRKTIKKPYDNKIAQHSFSFFRGTLLHKLVNPDTSPFPKLAKWLLKQDKTLINTPLGEKFKEIFHIKECSIKTNIKDITHSEEKPALLKAKKFNTKSAFGELTARAMTRTTKIGTIVLGGLEAAHLIKAIYDGNDVLKETAKSAINLTSTIVGIGYGGAIGAKYFGAAGSLVGMGLGAIASNKISKLMD